MNRCKKCGAELTGDEIGLTKKLIGKGEKEYLCLHCLANLFECNAELLKEKIEQYRASGCLLFAQK